MSAANRRIRWAIFLIAASLMAFAIRYWGREAPPETWTPPAPAELAEALGATNDLPERDRRVFADAGHELKRSPLPNDWLARRIEFGETYQSFATSTVGSVDPRRRKIYLQPLGRLEPDRDRLLEQLAEFGRRFFAREAEIQPPLELPPGLTRRTRPSTGREQTLASDILSWLSQEVPEDAQCRVGITAADLYPAPDWNSVFGQASLRDRVGVVSLARFDPSFFGDPPHPGDDLLFLRRTFHVFSHEIGHTFGLPHCPYYECLMNGANNLGELDRQSPHPCPICLRKLMHVSPFDPVARCSSLADFYAQAGLKEEAEWLRRRAWWIENGDGGR